MDPFTEYTLEIEGLGTLTVLDPQGEPGYRVRLPDGQVTAFPAVSGEPSEANALVDIAHAIANPQVPEVSAEQSYADALASGYLDVPTGIKLKTTDSAQAKFTSQVTLIQVALAAGAITSASTQAIWDYYDQPHELSTSAFLGLILRYGMHCKTIFDEHAP